MHQFTKPSISPLQQLHTNLLKSKKITLFVKRDDLLHPYVSGNKWRKLKYNLLTAKAAQQQTLLTFGGAFSNHIYSTAAAGKIFDFTTIGIIRGERIEPLNPTLAFAEKMGMQLHFVSRTDYRKKDSLEYQNQLRKLFGDFYVVPEGGTNKLALKGVAEVVEEVKGQLQLPKLPNYWCAACGTGGTLAGIIQGLAGTQKALGFSALKGDFHQKEIEQLLGAASFNNWSIHTDYHFGGYAKFKSELIDFINQFKAKTDIQLEPIYTGKLFYGIYDLIKNDYFPQGSSILAVHSGGLQGIDGFNQRFGNLIYE